MRLVSFERVVWRTLSNGANTGSKKTYGRDTGYDAPRIAQPPPK